MEFKPEIISLYRYFAYAAHMRSLFAHEVGPDWFDMIKKDPYGIIMFFYSAPGIYLLYSYSGIYLVIEGYRDLRLNDPKIDQLIASPFVDRLRLFRNATFHYQKDPIGWKHLQFFGTEEEKTEEWFNALYTEFERFFRENTLPLPGKLRESLRDKSHVQIADAIKQYWMEQD
jgi:hypothetical protein